ncbi:tRNA (adenosine(37)-N6)-threonylcarbamoyltransferase complex ATPase subunit type 1 TsaE [Chloroflexota bacterium]
MSSYIYQSNRPAATFNVGKRLGKKLEAGSILALMGELGCGKTLITRGICAGLGVPDRQVNSPTFVLVNEYRGRLPVFHLDLYRLEGVEDSFEIGLPDYFLRAAEGVMLVEWAEKIMPILPDDIIKVEFQILGNDKREITFSVADDKRKKWLEGLDKR